MFAMALARALQIRREGSRFGTLPKPSALSFTIVQTTTHSRYAKLYAARPSAWR